MYIETSHDEFLAGAFTRAVVIEFVIALASDCGEWDRRYYGLGKEHMGTVVGTKT